MKNWSLNRKLGMVLAFAIVSGAATSTLGIYKFNQFGALFHEVAGTFVKRNEMTAQMLDNQRQLIILNKEFLLARTPEKIASIDSKIAEKQKEVKTLVEERLKISSAKGAEVVKEYSAKLEKWFPVLAEVRKLHRAGMTTEALDLTERTEDGLRLEALKTLRGLNELAITQLADVTRDAEGIFKSALTLTILISIFTALACSLLGFFVLKALGKAIDKIVSELADSANQVTSASQQIAASSEELSQASTEQASSLQQTASSIEQMSSMIQRSSENARKTSEVATSSQSSAVKGKEVMQQMSRSIDQINTSNTEIMNQVNESNKEISEIVKVIGEIGNKTKVINDIVFQTKLLSFNASVEAARAGEYGKGFAVVAEEVGNLAQMSGNAAKEISAMLEESIQKVENIVNNTKSKVERLIAVGKEKVQEGTEVSAQCSDVLEEIVTQVSSAAQMAEDIAKASNEQALGIQEVRKAMGQLDQVTQQNASTSEEAASSAEELSAQAEALRRLVRDLVSTVKGEEGTVTGASAPLRKAETPALSKAPATRHNGAAKGAKVIHLRTAASNGQDHADHPSSGNGALKKAAGGYDDVPAASDPRFKDV